MSDLIARDVFNQSEKVSDKSSELNNVRDIRFRKLALLAEQLESDCYEGRASEESKRDFLNNIFLLRDKDRC